MSKEQRGIQSKRLASMAAMAAQARWGSKSEERVSIRHKSAH
jgi:hypothetical protein